MRVHYSSNNSGGSWWLDDDDWLALEAAGWEVEWFRDNPNGFIRNGEDRFLGALATDAYREVDDPQTAINEWTRITGCDPSDEGCNCCGSPHTFSYVDDDGQYHYTSVEVTSTAVRWS